MSQLDLPSEESFVGDSISQQVDDFVREFSRSISPRQILGSLISPAEEQGQRSIRAGASSGYLSEFGTTAATNFPGNAWSEEETQQLSHGEQELQVPIAEIAPQPSHISSPYRQLFNMNPPSEAISVSAEQINLLGSDSYTIEGQNVGSGHAYPTVCSQQYSIPNMHCHGSLMTPPAPSYYYATANGHLPPSMGNQNTYSDISSSSIYGYSGGYMQGGPSTTQYQWYPEHAQQTSLSLSSAASRTSTSNSSFNSDLASPASTASSSLPVTLPPTSPDPKRPYACLIPGCDLFMAQAEMTGHVKWHYRFKDKSEEIPVYCQVSDCKKPGPFKIASMSRHFKGHYADSLLEESCHMCGNQLSRQDALRRHLKSKHNIDLPSKKNTVMGRQGGQKKNGTTRASETALAEVLHMGSWKRPYVNRN